MSKLLVPARTSMRVAGGMASPPSWSVPNPRRRCLPEDF